MPSSPVQDYIEAIHADLADEDSGLLADYIPELTRADPEWFGIAIATADGAVYETGHSRQPFTIQSISKPFVYGLALEDHGRSDVFRRIGVEPTGDAFNSISLESRSGRPFNPMINAGAIATTGLVQGRSHEVRFQRILDLFQRYCGSPLSVDEAVYESESRTGHRNRAIGHMLRNFNVLEDNPAPVLENYFRQCSILVTCRDLAMIGATLANGGVQPITGEPVLRGEYVESVLSVMASCGMYDFAGEWIYRVGLPAKSGVGGGIVAVLPGQLGIGVFSPLLDDRGNSVRGIRVCQRLSLDLNLHFLNSPRSRRPAIRHRLTGADMRTRVQRPARQRDALAGLGATIRIYQLQGSLSFPATEPVLREVLGEGLPVQFVVLDLAHVCSIDTSASRLLFELLIQLSTAGIRMAFSGARPHSAFRRYCLSHLGPERQELWLHFCDARDALEWCEDQILGDAATCDHCSPCDLELLAGFHPSEKDSILELMRPCSFDAAETVFREGDAADALFFLISGRADARILLPSGEQQTVARFRPGVVFGEMAVIEDAPRSATVIAVDVCSCLRLPLEDFRRLAETHPAIRMRLLENFLVAFSRDRRSANCEVAALHR
ncbi:MAG TPA: glutaminase A [Verrucomicrobiales bacterium]|nr:glutaminase A [Verrucomicrobiales bacterium]